MSLRGVLELDKDLFARGWGFDFLLVKEIIDVLHKRGSAGEAKGESRVRKRSLGLGLGIGLETGHGWVDGDG